MKYSLYAFNLFFELNASYVHVHCWAPVISACGKPSVIRIPTLLAHVASQVVIMTTCGDTGDDKDGILTTIDFQWHCSHYSEYIPTNSLVFALCIVCAMIIALMNLCGSLSLYSSVLLHWHIGDPTEPPRCTTNHEPCTEIGNIFFGEMFVTDFTRSTSWDVR